MEDVRTMELDRALEEAGKSGLTLGRLAAQREGLPAILPRDDMPAPGAAPGFSILPPRGFLVGDFAECAIDVAGTPTVLFALFEWSVEAEIDMAEITGHGDFGKYYKPVRLAWRARARGYMNSVGVDHYIRLGMENAPVLAPLMTFSGWNGAANSGSPNLIWRGVCRCESAGINVPMAMADQSMVFRGEGLPTVGLAGL